MRAKVAFARVVIIVAIGFALGGCGPFLPGFEGILGIHSWTHNVPVSAVATTVQCELKDFLQTHSRYLDPKKSAGVQLTLQSDNSGAVTYVGIDLNRIGLSSVAELVSSQNKAPNLQAGLQGKSVTSSQIEFDVPQTLEGLKRVRCDDSVRRLPIPLDLDSWLTRFFKNLEAHADNTDTTCMSKVTVRTQFQLVVPIKGGVNPLFGTAFILPISGLSFEFSPAFTHTLQVAFSLNRNGPPNKLGVCPKTDPTVPGVSIRAESRGGVSFGLRHLLA
jgi:hypothetical protein